jgi:hypothetical protein
LTEMHDRISKGAFSLNRREEKLIKGIYGKDKLFEEAIEKPLRRGNLANVSSVTVNQEILHTTDVMFDGS